MHNDERKTRSDAIAHYLNEEELFLDIYRLGDFAEIVDEQTANHRIILLVDNKRGFSYPIVMPMAEQKDPTDLDIVLFMNKMKDERASFYAANQALPHCPSICSTIMRVSTVPVSAIFSPPLCRLRNNNSTASRQTAARPI